MAAIISTAASAVRMNAKATGIKTGAGSRAAFLSRKAARSVAAVAATRKVATRAIITETTAESSADSAELYKEFERLLVDYQFSYKVGDRVTGKVFHCDAKGAWVDIGAKAAALCPASESSLAEVRNVSTRKRDSDFLRARANDGEVATLAVPALRRSSRRRRAPTVAAPTETNSAFPRTARVDKAHDARDAFSPTPWSRTRGD
jgi:hypothetical protein